MLGIITAAVGFSYALATNPGSDDSVGVAARATGSNPGTPLQFVNTLVTGSTDYDLGDAAIGSSIVRYVRAKGGTAPYRFSSDTSTTTFADGTGGTLFIGTQTLAAAIAKLPASANPTLSTAVVNVTGLLNGQVGGGGGTIADGTPLRFDVTAADSKANPHKIDSVFRLTLVNSNTFKFAQSSLSDATTFRRYSDRVQVIAGNGPYTFTASNITMTPAPGVTITKLTDLGMFLNAKTGVLDGRPLFPGVLSFHCDCVDNKGNHALSRDKTTVGQTISVNVVAATRISTALFSTKLTITGNTTATGKDSIVYSGVLDFGSYKLSDLNGLGVTLTIANYTSPTAMLNNSGMGTGTGTGTPPAAMSVKIQSSGVITITIKDESFGKAGTIVTNNDLANPTDILVVDVDIISTTNVAALPQYHSSELLRFGVHAKSSKFTLNYKFGPNNLGGGFYITGVAGKDDKAETGDAWKVSFVALPPNAKNLANFPGITNANVAIGSDFFNTIAVTTNSTSVQGKSKTSGAVLTGFAYNLKTGKGGTTTGLLPYASALLNVQTQIKPALSAGGKSTAFPFVFTLTDTNNKELLGAEGSRRINPKGNQWVTK
jgi:hypothetical protein